MSYETRAYDNEHGDPVVVLVATGTHDVSRLVNLLHRGNTEQLGIGAQVVRQVRRHNAGRAALRLLRDHGGRDFTNEAPGSLDGTRPDRESLLAVARLVSRARCAPATDDDLTVALHALDELLDVAALAGSADDTAQET